MPLVAQMYCKEQVYIDGAYTWELKRLEKAVLQHCNAGYDVDMMSLLVFCRDWFTSLHEAELDRLAREEAWRREWSGKKGQVKTLIDSEVHDENIDACRGNSQAAYCGIVDYSFAFVCR